MRERFSSASAVPDKTFVYIKRCQTDIAREGITEQELEAELHVPPEELVCLGAELSTTIDGVATGGPAADIAILVEEYSERVPPRRLTGARKLRVIYKRFRSNARRAGL